MTSSFLARCLYWLALYVILSSGAQALFEWAGAPGPVDQKGDRSMLVFGMLAVLVGPFLETLIFQWGAFRLSRSLGAGSTTFAASSALLFALSHAWAPLHLVVTFGAGLIFCFAYLDFRERGMPDFAGVMLIHAGANALALAAMSASTT